MSTSIFASVVLSIGALSFALWVIKQELSFKKAVRKDIKIEIFLEKWLEKWLPKLKNELLFESGPYCARTMNKHSKLIQKILLDRPNIVTKIKIGADNEFKKDGEKLCGIFAEPGIVDRVDLAIIKKRERKQHFILIDGKHLLISFTDADGISQQMISFVKNKKKGKQFRDNFYEEWKNLQSYNIKEI